MSSQITLKFDGSFVKDNTITVRTLAHSLGALQQMVDKAVLYEKRGTIKKFDALPAAWYSLADLTVQPFEKGSVKIPLTGLKLSNTVSVLRGLLHDPFEEAISDDDISQKSLVEGLAFAINRADKKIDVKSHDEIIKDSEDLKKRYFAEAIYRYFDKLISPLRSSAITDKDLIAIELRDELGSKEYSFDKRASQRFHKIVSAKQLGPTIEYSGRLKVFGESNSRYFPYFGKFYSKASEQEHKLLIHKAAQIDELRSYNTAKKRELNFYGAPITAWGAFDERRGDIVFLTLKS